MTPSFYDIKSLNWDMFTSIWVSFQRLNTYERILRTAEYFWHILTEFWYFLKGRQFFHRFFNFWWKFSQTKFLWMWSECRKNSFPDMHQIRNFLKKKLFFLEKFLIMSCLITRIFEHNFGGQILITLPLIKAIWNSKKNSFLLSKIWYIKEGWLK